MSTAADALGRVRARIAAACERADRDPGTVTLIAVSKTFPASAVRAMIDAGHDRFGENRVQEALEKMDEVGPPARWDLVGSLQRNKARHVVGRFDLIHSVDGVKLAREIDRRAAAAGVVQAVLVQVNQAREETKAGVSTADVDRLLDDILPLDHLDVRGFMTIPPPARTPEDARRWFAALRELRDRAAGRVGRPFEELSMGMTGDFEVAIEEGATRIRVGRALFGERGVPA